MCYNYESSITNYSISLIISLFLLHRNRINDNWNASFILTFSLIQLIESGIWKNINNPKINSQLTKLIPIALVCQPLVQTFMAYNNNKDSKVLLYFLLIFIGFLVYTLLTLNDYEYKTHIGPNHHLVWEKNNKFIFNNYTIYLYLIGLVLGLLYMKPNYQRNILLSFGVLSFIYSLHQSNPEEFSTNWCFIGVVYGILSVV